MQSCARLKLSSLMDDAFDAPSITTSAVLSLSPPVGQFDLRLMQRKLASIGESPADCSSSSPSQTVDLSWQLQPFNPTELSLGIAMLCFALAYWEYQTETDSSMGKCHKGSSSRSELNCNVYRSALSFVDGGLMIYVISLSGPKDFRVSCLKE